MEKLTVTLSEQNEVAMWTTQREGSEDHLALQWLHNGSGTHQPLYVPMSLAVPIFKMAAEFAAARLGAPD